MQALILCGGQGLRIRGNFKRTPKPLIAVRGRPLLSYIIDHYRAHGIKELFLLVGDNENAFHAFANSYSMPGSFIRVLQTGRDTPTGGRLACSLSFLGDDKSVLVTYGDGISDVDIHALIACHEASGKSVTLTAVRPQLPFGLLELDSRGTVTSFVEKPHMTQYTNGGFFVVDRHVLEALEMDTDFETHMLPQLAEAGALGAYVHHGFWKSMDTYKDYMQLHDNALKLPV